MNFEMKPRQLLNLGIGLMGGGSLFSVIAGFSIPRILEERQKKTTEIKEAKGEKSSIVRENLKAAAKIALVSAPAVACEVVGAKCILDAYGTVKDFAISKAMAYTALAGTLETYRERVRERLGEEAEKEVYNGTKSEKIEIVETDENGKQKKVKKTVEISETEPLGYARIFAYGEAVGAERNFDYNVTFLNGMQSSFNRTLELKGYVYLNDVYEALGYPPSVAGQHVGWVYDRSSIHHGDNRIDLRIREIYRMNENGIYEKALSIDPNVDGEISQHLIDLGIMCL